MAEVQTEVVEAAVDLDNVTDITKVVELAEEDVANIVENMSSVERFRDPQHIFHAAGRSSD